MGEKDGSLLVKEVYPATGALQRIECLVRLSRGEGNYQDFVVRDRRNDNGRRDHR